MSESRRFGYAICRKNVDKVPFVFCNRHKEIPNFEQYNSVTDKKNKNCGGKSVMKKYTISKKDFDKFDWGCYMEGYKDASMLLLNSLPMDQNKINKNVILPTLFIIRHFLELSFKEIISHENFLYGSETVKIEHNLKKIWKKVKPKIENKNNKEEIDKVNKMVTFFDDNDPESFAFRYPKDNKGNPFFTKEMSVDIEFCKENFTVVQQFLSRIIIDYVRNVKYYK